MVARQTPSLNINGFDAMMTDYDPAGWLAYASADGTEFGDPEAVIASIASQLADGDLESHDRDGNREAKFYIGIEADPKAADPGVAIALGQQALELAIRFTGWAPLTWVDVLAGAEPSVMEMTSATVAKEFDDLAEMLQGKRVIAVTVHARPFVRPTDKITIDAPPVPGTSPAADVALDSGASTTGWTAAGLLSGVTNSMVLGASDPVFAGQVVGLSKRTFGSSVSQPWVSATRTLSIPVDASRPLLRITGTVRYRHDATLHMGYAGTVTVTATGATSSPVTVVNLTHDPATGDYSILMKQNSAVSSIKVTYQTPSAFVVSLYTLWVGVDAITRTVGLVSGVFTGAFQSRQVPIYGSQRTELSLGINGLNTAGDNAALLGEKVLVHTAAAGDDARSKFLSCRTMASTADPADPTAASGASTLLGTTASPTTFAFPVAKLLPGEYMVFARLKASSAGIRTLSYASTVSDGTGALGAADPATGWYTTPVTAKTSYDIFPIGTLMLPPAGIEDEAAVVSVKVAADTASVVTLDDIWVAHIESGQVTLLDTSGNVSAVRVDAATVDAPQPSVWVGLATSSGTAAMISAGTRIQAFDQHMAAPGLLQISTVTPGCTTSRVSASYYPRYAHDVAPLPA